MLTGVLRCMRPPCIQVTGGLEVLQRQATAIRTNKTCSQNTKFHANLKQNEPVALTCPNPIAIGG